MKKKLVFMLLFLSSSYIFSLGTDYFRNNKNINYLYVNSSEGLRIRDTQKLSGNKIGVLYDRMKVKVISIGDEETIDGIKSNWIRILLPIETIKSNVNEYGWIFGGYLTEQLEPFSIENWSDNDLKRYLCRFSWVTGTRSFYQFSLDGVYRMGLLESGAGGSGKYSVSIKNKTITVKASYGDEEYEGKVKTEVFKIIAITEECITLNKDGKEFILRPSVTHDYFYSFLNSKSTHFGTFEEPSYNALNFSFSSDMIKNIENGSFFKSNKDILIKMGIFIDDEEYIKQLNLYWK